MKKQYTIESVNEAIATVTTYIDGVVEQREIRYSIQSEDYCQAIEESGYTRAYDVKALKAALDNLEIEYNNAKDFYDSVKDKALVGTRVVEKPVLYWVSYIIHSEGSAPTLCAINQGQDTLEQAKEIIDRQREHFNVLSAWIDVFDENEVKRTVFHECYM